MLCLRNKLKQKQTQISQTKSELDQTKPIQNIEQNSELFEKSTAQLLVVAKY